MDILTVWVGSVLIAAVLTDQKGRGHLTGALLGLLFGPLGILLAYLVRPSLECRAAEQRKLDALVRGDRP